MKQKLAVLTVLGALLALAVPAGASATTLSPAAAKFEIAGGTAPKLKTSLGSCAVTKITGQVPKSPENHSEFGLTIAIPTPTTGSCSAGASITLAGEWALGIGAPYGFNVMGKSAEAVTMRFTSLPSCKLVSSALLNGFWINGMTGPLYNSVVHPHRTYPAKWANDGGTCAVAGQTETVSWEATSGSTGSEIGAAATVLNLTTPTTPIILSN